LLQEPSQSQPQQVQTPEQASHETHGDDFRDDIAGSSGDNARVGQKTEATRQRSKSPTAEDQLHKEDAGNHSDTVTEILTRSLTRTESPARLEVSSGDAAHEALDDSEEKAKELEQHDAVRRVSSPTRRRAQEARQESESQQNGSFSQNVAPPDNMNILRDELDSDADPASEGGESVGELMEEPMEGGDFGCQPGVNGMPRELTQLHHLEYVEMFQAVKVRMPEGTRPGQKISFTFARRQHEATVDDSQLGSEALFTVCAKRPPLERNAAHTSVRGRCNVHCGYDRHHIQEHLRQPPTIPSNNYSWDNSVRGVVLRSHVLQERNLLYKYLMGKNMDPILPNTPETIVEEEPDDL